ncbi:myc-type, basic helix-loop-helix (bHLH) domain-containing protein [Artemisia annua]|uniref:Myc-type, basic helix-loop-helix (BHLH) domain-containing protein n=1 Tax=Artemisia annua TaxID=35608 RepID=A0A2U1PTQ2_ARTAN|nr:myc-type, basic helix-loop-helix (bHLH) domain-containing protein [Artemisia annua]
MNQCVPSWDLEDFNSNLDIFKLGYEVAELTWENGQVAMHELGHRRVPSKSQPETSWDKPRAGETLEAIVTQATYQPYCKTHVVVNDNELVPSATMASDALVPSARDAGCSTHVGSCSNDPSAFLNERVACGGDDGGCATVRCHDMTMSGCGTYETFDTYDGDTGGQRLIETSMGSPENTSSGGDCLKSRSPDDSACHCRTKEVNVVTEKKRGKSESSTSTKRRRTAANHNQSERKRRDKINQKMKTLQKMVPNSNKTDKASMLDEVIEYLKQMQAQVHMVNRMNMPPMMMPLVMQQQQQQQQQMQMSMMNSMGLGMGMGMGMGMGFGGMDMNTMALSHLPTGFHPTTFMHMPWNNHITDRVVNYGPMAGDPMSAFRLSRSQVIPYLHCIFLSIPKFDCLI